MCLPLLIHLFFFSSRRRHTRWPRDWSSDVCSSDLSLRGGGAGERESRGALARAGAYRRVRRPSQLAAVAAEPAGARRRPAGHDLAADPELGAGLFAGALRHLGRRPLVDPADGPGENELSDACVRWGATSGSVAHRTVQQPPQSPRDAPGCGALIDGRGAADRSRSRSDGAPAAHGQLPRSGMMIWAGVFTEVSRASQVSSGAPITSARAMYE